MVGRSQAVLVTVNWNCKVEEMRIPVLNPIAIIREPKGLVRGVPACIWYCSMCLIWHIIVIGHVGELDYIVWIWLWTESTVMALLLLLYWILSIEYWLWTIRPESWRRLAFWCQSSRGVPVSIWIVYIWDDMFVYSYVVFSYRALAHGCCVDPQIKVKARLTNSELGDRGGLYMWASCVRILKRCDVVWVLYFVVRRHVLCHTG